jgi:hypothetical protein
MKHKTPNVNPDLPSSDVNAEYFISYRKNSRSSVSAYSMYCYCLPKSIGNLKARLKVVISWLF